MRISERETSGAGNAVATKVEKDASYFVRAQVRVPEESETDKELRWQLTFDDRGSGGRRLGGRVSSSSELEQITAERSVGWDALSDALYYRAVCQNADDIRLTLTATW